VLSERDEVMTVRHLAGGHDALRLVIVVSSAIDERMAETPG
jgi:hypothetical protein